MEANETEAELERVIAEANARAAEAQRDRIATEDRLDQLRRSRRPTYPTAEQRAGIAEAVRRVRERVPAKSHHGDPVGGGVTVVGPASFVMITTGAPVSRRTLRKLWEFTDAEKAAFLDEFESHGAIAIDAWDHNEGCSFIIST